MNVNVPIPPVDDRKFDDIVNQAIALATYYCQEWKPVSITGEDNNTDPAAALVYLFAHLMEMIITRLNRVPEKYFLAFLDYIGAKLQPPSPARALLQFLLSDGAATDQWVPAGSQAATEETRDMEEHIFETQTGFVVTPVKLVNSFTWDSGHTGIEPVDRTARVTGLEEGEFEIFETKHATPAFYLGFDVPFSNDSHSLYFQVMEDAGGSRRLQWEYYGQGQWLRLNIKDDTRNLSTPGHVHFIGPGDFSPTQLNGRELYWLRVRLLEASTPFSPKLGQVFLNTVWAENVETIKDELLGSSDGSPGQTFQLKHSPVLPGQQVWVKELEIPTDADTQKIFAREGPDALVIHRDEKEGVTEIRVRWHEVANFYASGPRDRHYIMESSTGKLYFGDGTRGMIPSMGTDNIYCSFYRTGGGSKGNLEPGKITEIKMTLPYIDSVTNPLPTGGGVDGETLEELKERGPFKLKHRDRAVTVEDFEWMMKEAPGDIAVCKCIQAESPDSSGEVNVIIVPDLDDPKPFPPESLLRKVESYIYRRSLFSLTANRTPGVHVTGPGYIEVSVDAAVVPISIEQAGKVQEKVIANLEHFFHPLKGGPEHSGWPFGRNVSVSEVMEVIQDSEGVDYVKSLRLTAPVQIFNLTLREPVPLYFPPGAAVSSPDGKIKYRLAEEVDQTHKLIVIGFKKDDPVKISRTNEHTMEETVIKDLRVVSTAGNRLTLSIEPNQDIPVGSIISTADESVKSYILETGPGAGTVRVKELCNYDPVIISCPDIDGYRCDGIVKEVDTKNPARVYLAPQYLVYSGTHNINMVPGQYIEK